MEEKIPERGEKEPTVFKDQGRMVVEQSLSFYEAVRTILYGRVVRIEAQRGKPDVIYNTKLYTDRNEEIWLSGFTCGKEHAGSLGLCELVSMIGWDKYVPRREIVRIVLTNNSFRMEFRRTGDNGKKRIYIIGKPDSNGSSPERVDGDSN